MEPDYTWTRTARSQADDQYDCLSQELESADFTSTEVKQLSSPGSPEHAGKKPVGLPESPCQESEATVEQHRPRNNKHCLDTFVERGDAWKRACLGGSEVTDGSHSRKQRDCTLFSGLGFPWVSHRTWQAGSDSDDELLGDVVAESQLQIHSAVSPSSISPLLKPCQLAHQPPAVAKNQGFLHVSSSKDLSPPSQLPWQSPSLLKQPLEVPGSLQAMSISPDGRTIACSAFKSREIASSMYSAGSGSSSGALPHWPKRKRGGLKSGLLHLHSQHPPAPRAVSSLSLGQRHRVSSPVVKTQRPDTPATLAISGGSGAGTLWPADKHKFLAKYILPAGKSRLIEESWDDNAYVQGPLPDDLDVEE